MVWDANQAGEDVGAKATSSQGLGFKELAFKGYGADHSTSSARVSTAHKQSSSPMETLLQRKFSRTVLAHCLRPGATEVTRKSSLRFLGLGF